MRAWGVDGRATAAALGRSVRSNLHPNLEHFVAVGAATRGYRPCFHIEPGVFLSRLVQMEQKVLYDGLLVEQIDSLKGCSNDLVKIQQCCNSIAFLARQLSRDENFLSPFAKNARLNGYIDCSGGKEDDVTVVLATVSLGSNLYSSTS